MYIPRRFRELDPDRIDQFIQANDFATLVTFDGQRPVASHLLIQPERTSDGALLLNGHMARANKQWQTLDPEQDALAIFSGPHTYISPRWYGHTNVPTWNYLTVHAYGRPRLITAPDELYPMLKKLVDTYEAESGASPPYQLETLPADFVARELQAIVGFQIRVTQLDGNFKLSQNREPADYDNIVAELARRPDEHSRAVGQAMAQNRERLFGAD